MNILMVLWLVFVYAATIYVAAFCVIIIAVCIVALIYLSQE